LSRKSFPTVPGEGTGRYLKGEARDLVGGEQAPAHRLTRICC